MAYRTPSSLQRVTFSQGSYQPEAYESPAYGGRPMPAADPYRRTSDFQFESSRSANYSQYPPSGPRPHQQQQLIPDFNSDLFDCCAESSETSECLVSFIVPPVQIGITEELHDSTSCAPTAALTCAIDLCTAGCGTRVIGFIKRRKYIEAYGMQRDACNDCLAYFCCPCCAVAQDAREVRIRGNVKMMMPPPAQMMAPNAGYAAGPVGYGYGGPALPPSGYGGGRDVVV
eukprot:tig00000310_g23983.t1